MKSYPVLVTIKLINLALNQLADQKVFSFSGLVSIDSKKN
jgi:hypothetical protein